MAVLHEIRGKVENILGDKKKAELSFEQDLDEDIKKLASNQGDITSLLYNTVCLQVPLVWKTRNSSRNVAVKRISDFQKRWGNSGPFDWFAAD